MGRWFLSLLCLAIAAPGLSNTSVADAETTYQRSEQLRPFELPIRITTPTGELKIVTVTVDPRQPFSADLQAFLESQGLSDAIGDAVSSRLEARRDACYEHELWQHISHEATNSFVAAMQTRDPRSRRGDVPMLRTLADRSEFPLLLNQMKLNGPWAELGVLKGEFSTHLLVHGNTSKLHLVDMWSEVDIYNEHASNANLEATKLAMRQFPGRYKLHQAMTSEAVHQFEDGYFDFIYVDATHSYVDARSDIEAWWPKLRVGGVMAGDDYYNGYVDAAGQTFGVKDAVDEFGARTNHRVYLTSTSKAGAFNGNDFVMQQFYILKCSE